VTGEPSHLSIAELTDLIEGRLTPAAQGAARAHIEGCARCARDLGWLERVISLMRDDDREEPPARVAAAITRAFEARKLPPQMAPIRLVAALSFDSAFAAPAARRGASHERQLVFLAADVALDLRLIPAGANWKVAGQVVGGATGGQVELRGASANANATLSQLGEFALPAIPAGTYALTLHLGALEIEVTTLEIGV
jgi:anti-sigma factor RsiW